MMVHRSSKRRYRGQTVDALRQERRERLLRAALQLFGTKGYGATSIESLCSVARVAPRHFYEHFHNREAVLQAIYQQITLEGKNIVQQALNAPGDKRERAVAAVLAFTRYYTEDPRRARIGSLEVVGVSAETEALRRQTTHEFATIIADHAIELVTGAALEKRHYLLVGISLVGAINELVVEWLAGTLTMTADDVVSHITALFRLVLVGAERLHMEGQLTQLASPPPPASNP
jgi:AcrR family transcriptional regulator